MRPSLPAPLRIFAVPAALALVSGFGLVAALVGDGPVDLLAAAAVAAPVAALLWALLKCRR